MASKKISELDAGSAVDGTETVAIVQGGGTVRALISAIKDYILGLQNTFTDVQTISAADAGLSLKSTATAANTEAYVAGFIPDAALTLRKVGAEAWTWGSNDTNSGYGVWNVHITTLTAGVPTDEFGLLLSGHHGATFFSNGFAAADLPGEDGTIRVNAPAGKGRLNFFNPLGNRFSLGLSGAIEGDTTTDAAVFSENGIRIYVAGSATPVASVTTAGTIATKASATGGSGLRLPHGSAPTSPVDGDMWTTTAGLFIRINGSTVGPLS